MQAARALIALSVATLATACASRGTTSASPPACMVPMAMGVAGSTAAPDSRMKATQGGMAMMKEMQAMHAGGGAGGMGMMGSSGGSAPMAGMGDGKAMPADLAKRHQMMTDQVAMMQTMIETMADRMPPAAMSK